MLVRVAAVRGLCTRTAEGGAVLPFEKIPGPRKHRLVGNLPYFRTGGRTIPTLAKSLQQLNAEFGPIVKTDFGWDRGAVVHVFEPEDAKIVFQSDGKMPVITPLQETTQQYRKMRGFNPGLGNLNGEPWYRLRSAAQQSMMRPQAVKQYLPLVNAVANDFVRFIEENRSSDKNSEINMRMAGGRWSLESAGLLIFEKRLGVFTEEAGQWADDLIETNRNIFILSGDLAYSLPLYRYISTPKWKKFVKFEDAFYNEAHKLINETIHRLRKENTADKDLKFVSHLARNPELTDQDISILMLSMFSDGLSTTSPTLIYNLYNIAKHPKVQEKLFREIDSVLAKRNDIMAADLANLPYLKACIKESFRLFPIGTDISRIPQTDLVLSGYRIPAGTPIEINTNVLSQSEKLYKKPKQFIPERWLRGDTGVEVHDSHPFAFLPFGHGPRMCAGRRFAEQDLQVALAKLVRKFHINFFYGTLTQKYETLLLPHGCCKFQFLPRSKTTKK
uniref:Cytochrome P450 CYP44 n=1 Tax=Steinernema glaseri TaxID=37863 RepID=A0A1I7YHL0_9BILA